MDDLDSESRQMWITVLAVVSSPHQVLLVSQSISLSVKTVCKNFDHPSRISIVVFFIALTCLYAHGETRSQYTERPR